MLGYLRIKLRIQRIYGIPFTSLLLFRLFVLWFLRAFPLTCYNQIGQQYVAPTGWSSQESLFIVFTLQRLVLLLLLFSFFFGGRIPHPSFILLFSINISIYRFLSKILLGLIRLLPNVINMLFLSFRGFEDTPIGRVL